MTNQRPLVSIGMMVYNSEQHIGQALDSLLAQDYEHFELIIADNASTDRTEKICREYAARDKRVRYYRNQRNMGVVWSANRLLELSSGEYFKWAGSYDYVAPSFISACKHILDNDPRVVLAYPLARFVNGNGEAIGEIMPEIIDTRGLRASARVLVVLSKMQKAAFQLYGLFRTSALRRCRPLSTVIGNDMVLIMEISILGAIALVPEVLFYNRELGPVLTEDERIASSLLKLDPDAWKRKHRPFWEVGIQHLMGTWRVAPLTKTFYLLPLVAHTYYSRWHKRLKRELQHPYSLQEYKEPEY